MVAVWGETFFVVFERISVVGWSAIFWIGETTISA